MRIVHSAIAAIVVSLALGACSAAGSSFYPAGPSSVLAPGSMSVSVEAEAPFDFEHAQYTLVFNTSGTAATPNTGGRVSNWKTYSYGVIAGGDGKATAGPVAFLRNGNPAMAPAILPLRALPQQFTFNPNSDGLGTEYRITFSRRIFGVSTQAPVKTPWTFDLVVSAPNLHDARFHVISGMGGACAHCFVSPRLDVTRPFDVVRYVTVGPTSGDPATHIVRVELVNNP